MGLEIKFLESPPIFGPSYHLVIDDGCEVDLNTSGNITSEQKVAIDGWADYDRGRHLFYLNKQVTDEMIKRGAINLRCPACKNQYKLTPEEYDLAFKKFLKHTWE